MTLDIADMKAKALANLSTEAEYFSSETEKHTQEILALIAALEAANQRADAAEAALSAERAKARHVTDTMVEVALDTYFPGEDWRQTLGEALAPALRDMRAAIVAALSERQ